MADSVASDNPDAVMKPKSQASSKEDSLDYRVNRRKILRDMQKITKVDEVHAKEGTKIIRGYTISNKPLADTYLGHLFKSKDTRDDKKVLVKSIITIEIDDFRRRHLKENTYRILWFLKQTQFKHMIEIYDYFNLNNVSLVIVEEYLRYPLYAILSTVGSLRSEREIKQFSEGLAEAIMFLHNAGIAHQNVNVHNVYVMPHNKQVKLGAVEYSIIYWDAEKDEALKQTLKTDVPPGGAVALEVTSGQPYDPSKSDVYSFGSVVYYMVNGQYPYNEDPSGKDKTSWEEQMVTAAAQFEKVMSANAVDVISKCVKKAPEERMDIRDVLEHPWFSDGLSKA